MADFTRAALLTPEFEDQLKKEMKNLWDDNLPAKQIAKDLHFGENIKVKVIVDGKEKWIKNPYINLKLHNVWCYRQKWNFPKRGNVGIPKGQKRYKHKQEAVMSFAEFKDRLDTVVPKVEYDNSDLAKYVCRKRAFLILHFWSPLRCSETRERKRKDFRVEGDLLTIFLYRKKKYYKPNADMEPFHIPLSNDKETLMSEVLEWLNLFEQNERPFNFCGGTAWNYVKDVFPDYYVHFWRHNWITKGIDNAKDPRTILGKMLKDTGLDIRTIKNYIMQNPKYKASIGREMIEMELKT